MYLAVDEMLLTRYVNWSTKFRSMSLQVKMGPFWLKRMNFVLFICIQVDSYSNRIFRAYIVISKRGPVITCGFNCFVSYFCVEPGGSLSRRFCHRRYSL